VNGAVDEAGRALVTLRIRPADRSAGSDLPAWIDTAFTGELVVPRREIVALGLKQSAAVMAKLADGSEVVLESYSCLLEWFDGETLVEVIENDGDFALLGVGLLLGRRLEIDYRFKSIRIE
jgi:predicted aspartyl protease